MTASCDMAAEPWPAIASAPPVQKASPPTMRSTQYAIHARPITPTKRPSANITADSASAAICSR